MSDVFFFDPNHPPFYQLISFTEVGTHTFSMSQVTPPDDGYDIDYVLVTCYGGGEGGDRAEYSTRGGRAGGRVSRRLSPAVVGTSQSVAVGAGGAGRTGSNGQGGSGGVSSFGDLVQSRPDTSWVETIFGPLPSSGAPGRGGDSGSLSRNTRDTGAGGNVTDYYPGPGQDGDSSSGALGGQGAIPAAWFGSTASPATVGEDGGRIGWYTFGGAGGGGGHGRNSAGANGGSPGGGGGGGSNANGGNGGRGQVDVLIVFKPATASLA